MRNAQLARGIPGEAIGDRSVGKIGELSALIDDCLRDLFDPDTPFALLDYPNHGNIGDSAIYLGEAVYLEKRALKPAYVSTSRGIDWDALDAAIGPGHIFIHGGGNFGDIWPSFQAFRLEILRRYPRRKIVQLPQSLQFSSEAAIAATARAIEQHGLFTLLVRDLHSRDFAEKHFNCEIRLCPDMAFQLGPQQRSSPTHRVLLHLRGDREAAADFDTSQLTEVRGVVRSDWPREGRVPKWAMKARYMFNPTSLGAPQARWALRTQIYRDAAQWRVSRGLRLLSSARSVVTDRLHGHILSVLLGVPHCVIDNSYGKLTRFMSAWGTQMPHVHVVGSVAEAVETLSEHEALVLPGPS